MKNSNGKSNTSGKYLTDAASKISIGAIIDANVFIYANLAKKYIIGSKSMSIFILSIINIIVPVGISVNKIIEFLIFCEIKYITHKKIIMKIPANK